jgi:hypothetical protein
MFEILVALDEARRHTERKVGLDAPSSYRSRHRSARRPTLLSAMPKERTRRRFLRPWRYVTALHQR